MSSRLKPRFRLAGIYEGRSLCFDVSGGELSVGSAPDNAVRLPVAGVSRRHAMLDVGPEGLRVEDLGSKNGTFVDGVRVLRAAAGDGARLAFGPVELVAESVDPGAALAIRFAAVAPGGSSWADDAPSETAMVVAVDLPDESPSEPTDGHAGALDLVDGLGTVLAEGSVGDALGTLVDRLGARGACLVEWSAAGEPLAVETCRDPGDVPTLEQLRRRLGKAEPVGGWFGGAWRSDSSADAVRVGVARFGPGPASALVVLGVEVRDLQVLRIVARQLFAARHSTERRVAPRRRVGDVELCFPPGFVTGTAPATQEFYRQMAAVCRLRSPVLLHGETGVGKELLARTLHASIDPSAPYEVVNCAAIPSDLLEAEMFGVTKGAATGVTARRGHFERADGGTLFLDEIGELAPSLQAKLLRTLQEGEIQPVGGPPRPVDVLVIAATHVDLESGALRRDLYYRLAVGLLEVPPLRRAQADIPGLVQHYVLEASAEVGIHVHGVTSDALERLQAYGWPGNVRELAFTLRRLVAGLRSGDVIDVAALPSSIQAVPSHPEVLPSVEACGDSLELKPRVEAVERRLIREAMVRSGGRQVEAARRLGVSRSGLAKMLRRLDLKDSWVLPSTSGGGE